MIYLVIIIASLLVASVYEWAIHRYVMHKPVRFGIGTFDYPFKAHAKVHHQVFKADESYHLDSHHNHDVDKGTIPMEWWNGPALCIVATLPTIILSVIFDNWLISGTFLAVLVVYYGVYEYIHWCMHLPKNHPMRLVERLWVFRRLNAHHLLHHRYMHKNFNVVLPFADLIFGTLMIRSKRKFRQAMGPQVPIVQPEE